MTQKQLGLSVISVWEGPSLWKSDVTSSSTFENDSLCMFHEYLDNQIRCTQTSTSSHRPDCDSITVSRPCGEQTSKVLNVRCGGSNETQYNTRVGQFHKDYVAGGTKATASASFLPRHRSSCHADQQGLPSFTHKYTWQALHRNHVFRRLKGLLPSVTPGWSLT